MMQQLYQLIHSRSKNVSNSAKFLFVWDSSWCAQIDDKLMGCFDLNVNGDAKHSLGMVWSEGTVLFLAFVLILPLFLQPLGMHMQCSAIKTRGNSTTYMAMNDRLQTGTVTVPRTITEGLKQTSHLKTSSICSLVVDSPLVCNICGSERISNNFSK